MRYLTTAAMALVLAASGGAALAQPEGGGQKDQHGQHHQGGGGQQGGHGSQGGVHNQGGVKGGHNFTTQGGQGQTGGQGGHHTFTQQYGGQTGGQHVAGQTGHPQGLQFHQHALRGRDQGRVYYSAGNFRAHMVVTNRFHVAVWSRPGGWYYRPWVFGMFLPWGWFLPAYYLDWGLYDLPPPPIGCEWVREGPDAVLVDIWTGEILSVYSGVFY